jgi:hypothetical protein
MMPRIRDEIPKCEANCLSLVRIQLYDPVDAVIAPVEGVIYYDGSYKGIP